MPKKLSERILDAEAACNRWLADGNEAKERGATKTAERYYERSQRWLDRANALREQQLALASPVSLPQVAAPSEYTYHNPMPMHRFVERYLIQKLVAALAEHGWTPREFMDENGEHVDVKTADDIWPEFLKTGEGTIYFGKRGQCHAGVILTNGNGSDVINTFCERLPKAAMESVYLY